MNLQRGNCGVCGEFTMLVSVSRGTVKHAQCGNNNCKSNKQEVTMKAKIQKLMNTHLLSHTEVINAIDFVSELLDLELQHDEHVYPRALVSHDKHRKAYQVVRDLEEFFNEHYKNTK